MEVILLERIEKLGGMGDVVGVKDGYARNFLLPRKKALRATPENMERFEREREALEQLNGDRRDAARSAATRLEGESIILIRQASDTLQLYGSVSARDIAEEMSGRGAEVRRQQVRLDRPIKALGVHEVRIALHPEVTVIVKVNVARSPEEAEIQARGGTILDEVDDEADEAAPAEPSAVETADGGDTPEADASVDEAGGSDAPEAQAVADEAGPEDESGPASESAPEDEGAPRD